MYRQSFKTPEKSISPLHAQIFLPKSLVKISFSAKDFQRHRQACTISSFSSIIEIRLAMTHEPDNQYLVRRFYELKTTFLCLKKLVWRKLMQIIWVLRKKNNLDRFYIFQPPKMQQAHNRCSKSIKYDKGAFHLIFTSSNRDVPWRKLF